MPLYNVIYTKSASDLFVYNGNLNDTQVEYYKDLYLKTSIQNDNIAIIAANKANMLSIFDETYDINDWYTLTNTEDFRRHNSLNNDGIQSNEYIPYYTNTDINDLIKLSGNEYIVKNIYGKYFVDDSDNLRTMFNPDILLKENINSIYFSNFFMFYFNGANYPVYFYIYTTKDDTENIKLYYNNNFINAIVGENIIDVSLPSIFSSNQNTIYNDIIDVDKLNDKYFIVQTLFNVGIFLNTDNGILRYIPFELSKKFFNIIFNKMNVIHDGNFHLYSGAAEKNLVLTKVYNKYSYNQVMKEYNEGFKDNMPISISNNSLNNILLDKKTITQDTLYNIDCLSNLFSLTSNANYFNDLIFDIAKSGESLTLPIMLVNG